MQPPRHPSPTHCIWPTEGTVPLSVAIVCKDAKHTIARTIRSVRGIAREVIVLDSGSTDGTLSVLNRLGIAPLHQNWLGYIAQKNCALNMCRQPWVLSLDSDESLEPDLRDAVLDAMRRNDPAIAGYEMNRKVWYKHKYLHHAWQPEWRLRLVRCGSAEWTGYDPHDSLVLKSAATGRIERLRGTMRHDSIDTIAGFLAKQCKHGHTAATALHKQGRKGRVRDLALSPVGAWFKQMIVKQAWRDGWRGWLAASASAIAAMSKHAALLELSLADRDAPPPGASRTSSTGLSSSGDGDPHGSSTLISDPGDSKGWSQS